MNERFGSNGWKPSAVAAMTAAVVVLLAGALPAAALAAEDDGERHELKERRMIVLSPDGEGNGPQVFTQFLRGGYLGVELTALTPELRAHFGVPADRGVMVARVAEDSPASRAGLQVGDVIAEVDGKAVEGPWDLGTAIRSHGAGEEADLVVWRDRRSLDFRVRVEERERQAIDIGQVFDKRLGEVPRILQWKQEGGPGEIPTLYFEPESVERLGEALEKMDWTRLAPGGLAERNRELETRLQELEERLQELEEALRRSQR